MGYWMNQNQLRAFAGYYYFLLCFLLHCIYHKKVSLVNINTCVSNVNRSTSKNSLQQLIPAWVIFVKEQNIYIFISFIFIISFFI